MTSCLARLGGFFLVVFLLVPGIAYTQQAGDQTAAAQQQMTGSINGTVVDTSGAVVSGAKVRLTSKDQVPPQEVATGSNGSYTFANVTPGDFQVIVTAASFAPKTFAGMLQPGQAFEAPPTVLGAGEANVVVQVGSSVAEVAQAQIKQQEQQRVIAFVPNFYVTYLPDPAPMNSKQKFQLAWKQSIDPGSFVLAGALAGVEQWQNYYSGYGQGAEGYAKRFGASYADSVTSTFFGSGIFPALFKQDPRYFYRGTGSKRSRFMHAVASAVIARGDNKRLQPNYSGMLGALAASGLSNTYYPKNERGVGLTFENAAVGIGTTAAINVLQEFVVRKLTPNASKSDPSRAHPSKGL
ncbi:MAG: carboxypeptidase-like regulatory domain-containing protein [Terriglobales bacterium]